ncbi:hypothetical protein [Benzoatithermus flavus]|uniref:Uncharacterized protein n=1 Tax=Benzoatithermus flavus TaxID=3108223 RepID=A0ABU8XTF3_9PROT
MAPYRGRQLLLALGPLLLLGLVAVCLALWLAPRDPEPATGMAITTVPLRLVDGPGDQARKEPASTAWR